MWTVTYRRKEGDEEIRDGQASTRWFKEDRVGKESKRFWLLWNLWWQKEKLRLTSRSLKFTEAW